MRLTLEEQQKYLQSFINNAIYYPKNPILTLHIRESIYLVLTNALSTSFLIFHITFDEISTILSNYDKGRCAGYMWSNNMLVLWNHVSAIFDEDRKCCLHVFPK